MKKSFVSVLTMTLTVGSACTTFAAANPFSDVPVGHWAYDAVAQLATDGVIEGYGDGTFRGDRSITRYEMAQMIAKAMAKNPSGGDKAMLDRLAAEFREELNNLGVRVSNLEKHADMVQWSGKLEYTYHSTRIRDSISGDTAKVNVNGYVFRLEPKAEVNDHWTVNARLDAEGNMKHDTTTDVSLKRAWAQGDYNNFQVKLGRFEFNPAPEHGLLWDTEISGAEMTFGKDFYGTIVVGRLSEDKVRPGVRLSDSTGWSNTGITPITDFYETSARLHSNAPSSLVGIRVQYDNPESKLYGGVGYYHIKDSDLKTLDQDLARNGYNDFYTYSRSRNEDTASIWTVNVGYRFSKKANLWANYAKNTKTDFEDTSWQSEFDYGTYQDRPEKGDWSIYAGYRRFGYNTTFQGTMYDDALRGTKGWVLGAKYAPFKNVGLIAKYFKGKTITGGEKAEKLFGRVEFFF